MIQLTIYAKTANSPEENKLNATLSALSERYDFQVSRVDVSANPYLLRNLPGGPVQVDVSQSPIRDIGNPREIEAAIVECEKRLAAANKTDNASLIQQYRRPGRMTGSDRFTLWFTRHYVLLFSLLLILYAGLPFLAPVLMKTGHPTAANWIYKPYKYLCHQLAYRSFFLFGEQVAYPRAIAGVETLKTFGEATGLSEYDLKIASDFVGNDTVGYKIALCQRDLGIYISLLLFGIVFGLTGKRLKPLAWWVWILFGLLPIALDGGSQMISQFNLPFLSWFPIRESTPLLRVATGVLFGSLTAWLGYPSLEETSRDARLQLEKKAALAASLEGTP